MDAINYLSLEFESRVKRRKSYSLRSFARDLGVSPGSLSLILSQKRPLTVKLGQKIAQALKMSEAQTRRFLLGLMEAKLQNQKLNQQSEEKQLADDEFQLVSQWYMFAILSLAKLPKCKSSADWVAKRIGIEVLQAEVSINRLLRLGYLEKKGSFLQRIEKPIRTTNQIPSKLRRDFHRQLLNLASEKLESIDMKNREMTSVTMIADPKNIEKVKDMIRSFKDQVSDEIGLGKPTEVYTLSLELFPLTLPE